MTRAPDDYAGWAFDSIEDSSVQCPDCLTWILLPASLPELLGKADEHKQCCYSNHVTRTVTGPALPQAGSAYGS